MEPLAEEAAACEEIVTAARARVPWDARAAPKAGGPPRARRGRAKAVAARLPRVTRGQSTPSAGASADVGGCASPAVSPVGSGTSNEWRRRRSSEPDAATTARTATTAEDDGDEPWLASVAPAVAAQSRPAAAPAVLVTHSGAEARQACDVDGSPRSFTPRGGSESDSLDGEGDGDGGVGPGIIIAPPPRGAAAGGSSVGRGAGGTAAVGGAGGGGVGQLSSYLAGAERQLAALEAALGVTPDETPVATPGTVTRNTSNAVVYAVLQYETMLRCVAVPVCEAFGVPCVRRCRLRDRLFLCPRKLLASTVRVYAYARAVERTYAVRVGAEHVPRRELYQTAVRNSHAFHTVPTLKEQNEAFDETTAALRALREQCLVVLDAVAAWHRTVGEPRAFLWNGKSLLPQVCACSSTRPSSRAVGFTSSIPP